MRVIVSFFAIGFVFFASSSQACQYRFPLNGIYSYYVQVKLDAGGEEFRCRYSHESDSYTLVYVCSGIKNSVAGVGTFEIQKNQSSASIRYEVSNGNSASMVKLSCQKSSY